MYSETRLIIQEIDHTSAGMQFNESDAVIYRTESVTLDTEARVSSAQLTAKIPVTGNTIPRPGSMVIFEATNDEGEFVRVFVGFVFSFLWLVFFFRRIRIVFCLFRFLCR